MTAQGNETVPLESNVASWKGKLMWTPLSSISEKCSENLIEGTSLILRNVKTLLSSGSYGAPNVILGFSSKSPVHCTRIAHVERSSPPLGTPRSIGEP